MTELSTTNETSAQRRDELRVVAWRIKCLLNETDGLPESTIRFLVYLSELVCHRSSIPEGLQPSDMLTVIDAHGLRHDLPEEASISWQVCTVKSLR